MVNAAARGKNPWEELPGSGPFVLECDRKYMKPSTSSHLLLDRLPVPYNGARDAAVVLLMLNPGAGSTHGSSPDHLDQCRKRLIFASRVPFMSLDDAFAKMDGAIYWRKRLRRLMERVGIEKLRRHLLCLQYFPYPSKEYKALPETLPSQQFGFDLCREAIREQRLIVVMRSRHLWEAAVPELKKAHPVYLKNPRQPYLTPNNIQADGFERIVRALESTRS